MEKIKKGDIVARKSHNKDILFMVESIIKSSNGLSIVNLRGLTFRIIADAFLEDLVLIDKKEANISLRSFDLKIENRINNIINRDKLKPEYKNRNSIANINSGKILHLDGDKSYADKSSRYYKKIGLNAIVKSISEKKQPLVVREYIQMYKPDILVLTGHDGMIKNGIKFADLNNYRNSKYFIQSVIEARKLIPSSNKLAIFAGACQSFFEAIMSSGANFASSPGRILIDFMDPLIVAEKIATTDRNKFVTMNDMVKEVREGRRSIDGSGVMGKSRT